MIVHVIDGTYELFRHFYGLCRFTKGEDGLWARSSAIRTCFPALPTTSSRAARF